MKINFGLMAPILSEQLKEQKMFIKDSENYDKTIDCMNRLWVEGYITDKEREKIYKRIFKQIEKNAQGCEKC